MHLIIKDVSLAFEACPMTELKPVIARAQQQFPGNMDAQIQKIRADAQLLYRGHWNVIIFPGDLQPGIAWHLDSASHKYCQTVYNYRQYIIWASLC